MAPHNYQDIILSLSHSNKVGTIKLNRPKSLNAFGGNLMLDIIAGLRELNDHPETVFTVITGEGRFVSGTYLLDLSSHSLEGEAEATTTLLATPRTAERQ
jgi:enoyl-CoA hydratase/carnithine racemase